MKDNIKTAWAYFAKNAADGFIDKLTQEQLLIINKSMKEYAEQFIDLSYKSGYSDGRMKSGGWDINQRESILKVKQLIK